MKLNILPGGWPHAALHKRVRDAIETIPKHFQPKTYIDGIDPPDLQALGKALRGVIANQTVATLNASEMRSIWDPSNEYALYSFVRQPQIFPDVLLRRAPGSAASELSASDDIIMGIVLYGWYVLAKERKPTFRFTVTESACQPQDLMVVVPWALSRVTSGSPVAFTPYIGSASLVASARNEWWGREREAKADLMILHPAHPITPYTMRLPLYGRPIAAWIDDELESIE
jgi:hypothetical protein